MYITLTKKFGKQGVFSKHQKHYDKKNLFKTYGAVELAAREGEYFSVGYILPSLAISLYIKICSIVFYWR